MSSLSSMICSSMVTTTSRSVLAWNSMATNVAVSKSISWLMVAMTPISMSFLMTSEEVAFSRAASSPTVIISGMVMVICFF